MNFKGSSENEWNQVSWLAIQVFSEQPNSVLNNTSKAAFRNQTTSQASRHSRMIEYRRMGSRFPLRNMDGMQN